VTTTTGERALAVKIEKSGRSLYGAANTAEAGAGAERSGAAQALGETQ